MTNKDIYITNVWNSLPSDTVQIFLASKDLENQLVLNIRHSRAFVQIKFYLNNCHLPLPVF